MRLEKVFDFEPFIVKNLSGIFLARKNGQNQRFTFISQVAAFVQTREDSLLQFIAKNG